MHERQMTAVAANSNIVFEFGKNQGANDVDLNSKKIANKTVLEKNTVENPDAFNMSDMHASNKGWVEVKHKGKTKMGQSKEDYMQQSPTLPSTTNGPKTPFHVDVASTNRGSKLDFKHVNIATLRAEPISSSKNNTSLSHGNFSGPAFGRDKATSITNNKYKR
ncbi:hypothetical protein HN873_071083 [Arachis hypogaea]